MRGVQADGTTHALEFHSADLAEDDVRPRRGVDDLLADQDLARPGIVRDPRGEIHRLTKVVAFLEHHGPGMQTDVCRR
jgi:hypothetical protein